MDKHAAMSMAVAGLAITVAASAVEPVKAMTNRCDEPIIIVCTHEAAPPPDEPESERNDPAVEPPVAVGNRVAWVSAHGTSVSSGCVQITALRGAPASA